MNPRATSLVETSDPWRPKMVGTIVDTATHLRVDSVKVLNGTGHSCWYLAAYVHQVAS